MRTLQEQEARWRGVQPRTLRRTLLIVLVLAVPLAGCLGGDGDDEAPDDAPYADLVLVGGRVWTATAANTSATALAVTNGTITYVGDDAGADAYIGPATKVVTLDGGSVLPGLRDHHNHLVQYSNPNPDPDKRRFGAAAAEDYRPTYDPDPVGAAAFRAAVFSYHTRVFAEERSPVDNCHDNPPSAAMKQSLLTAQDEALKQGLVATTEAGLDDLGQYQALLELDEADELKLRFLIRWAWGCVDEAIERGWTQGHGSDHVRVVGVKMYSDGWLGPRSAAVQEPYEDRPGFDGYLFLDPERAAADVAKAKEAGFRITTHAIGDRAVRTVLDAYEANGVTPDDRWSIEHVSVFPDDLRTRMVDNGIVGSIQLSFATSDQHFLHDALGERENWTYPWRTALDEGMRLAGSSDFQIEVLHPLWGVQRTVTRQEVDGTPPGGYFPDEALTLEQALRLVTVDVAYVTGEDDRGTLEVGRRADLVAYAEDLFAVSPNEVAGATLVLNVVDGEVTFEGRESYPPPGTGEEIQRHAAAHRHAPGGGTDPGAQADHENHEVHAGHEGHGGGETDAAHLR